ncbi:54S ribosomal protein L4 [Paramyrothecium foliicola]|nr:54S ribosomal protein L4 [Paramyrothecium foliicola]
MNDIDQLYQGVLIVLICGSLLGDEHWLLVACDHVTKLSRAPTIWLVSDWLVAYLRSPKFPSFRVRPTPLRPAFGRAIHFQKSYGRTATVSVVRSTAAFSTTAQQNQRKTKDSNKKRGVSSIYGSGPKEPLSMSKVPLPQPRTHKPTIKVDENHGLWGFFPAPGQAFWTPKETEQHGRAWTLEELRRKSWEDLHALWWVCCRERNMLSTSRLDMVKAKIGFGEREFVTRDQEVLKTMRSIKQALTERYYTWQDAVEVAASDPEINLRGGEGEVYSPSTYEEEYDDVTEEWAAPETDATISTRDIKAEEVDKTKQPEKQALH